MGTTANYGWEYTDATDMLGAGFANDQTLAQQIDATVKANYNDAILRGAASYVHCDAGTAADVMVGNGASSLVDFGAIGATADWSQTDPSTFTYTGPNNRLVLVTAAVRLSAAQTSTGFPPVDAFNAKVALLHAGTVALELHESLTVSSVDPNLSIVRTAVVSTVVGMGNGQTLQLRVANASGPGASVKAQALGRSFKATSLGLY